MRRAVWTVAALAGAAWVPFLTAPASPDEGGFLLVASQWHPAGSLYGHYWVDRPPLLLALFDVAAHLGGTVGLRVMGVAVVVGSVLLAADLARVAGSRQVIVPACVAAVFLSTPLFGTTEVDGELLAVPLVLGGLACLVRASRGALPRSVARSVGWAVVAGAAGAAAVMVKQNVVDVLVVASLLVVGVVRRSGARRGLALAAGVGAGGLGVLGATLLLAEVRGTEPTRLWDAVVAFRAQASAVITASATSATSHRLDSLLLAVAASGAPLLVGVLLLRSRGPASPHEPPDLRAPAVALLVWEAVAVGAGGSYWLHYLIGLVPGMVLLAVAATQREVRLHRLTAAVLATTVASCVVAVVVAATAPTGLASDTEVAAYLRSHGTARDSVVVAFGHPDIVWDAGMHSPYEELWSLPVRVRDSSLADLSHVLRAHDAPTWIVVSGDSLATWGVDTTTAEHVMEQRYRRATAIGPYVVWRRVAAQSGGVKVGRVIMGR